MAVRDWFKISRKTFIDPASWIGVRSIKFSNQVMWSALKNLFTQPVPTHKETFEQAIERLGLTEEQVLQIAKRYRIYALFFSLFGLGVFFYAFYLLFSSHAFLGWSMGCAAAALFFAHGFKYDFWSLQMRRRQLGLTFQDWKESILS